MNFTTFSLATALVLTGLPLMADNAVQSTPLLKTSVGARVNAGTAKKLNADSDETGDFLAEAAELSLQIPSGDINTFVFGLELGQGSFDAKDSFRLGDRSYNIKSTIDLPLSALVKAGYGIRLGHESLALLSVGFGYTSASYKITQGALLTNDRGSGRISSLDLETIIPLASSLDLIIGGGIRGYRLKFDDINGQKNEFQTNVVSGSLGGRYNF